MFANIDGCIETSSLDKTFTRKSRQHELKKSSKAYKRKQWMKVFQNRVGIISQSDKSDAYQHLPYQYFPCNHSGVCDMNCDCVRHDTACEKFCACPTDCKLKLLVTHLQSGMSTQLATFFSYN